VNHRPAVRLLDEFDPLRDRLEGFVRGFPSVPAKLLGSRRDIDEAIFACCESPNSSRFSGLMRALGEMECSISQRDRSKRPTLVRPLLGLSPRWIKQCDDGGVEVRIAAALSSIRATGGVGPIRSNLSGVDARAPWKWATGNGQKRWFGNSLAERLGGVLVQRMMDGERNSVPRIPVEAGVMLCPEDVLSFLYGDTDDQKIEELLWGFLLVDWRREGAIELRRRWSAPVVNGTLPRSWCLLKLLFTPAKIRGVTIRRESRIPALLRAHRIEDACMVAHHRLRVSDLNPVPVRYEAELDPTRLLAGLLIPTRDQWRLESLILQEKKP